MQQVLDFVSRIAATDVSVLITGESGAGKEVMARTIHQQSLRQQAPFITVDCSAIAQTLIDSELFGRVKGAYTGADDASEGRIAQAHGGTLFLDEIGELPLDVQSKLLRFVQERELTPVGGTQTRRIDTRILCATNRNLLAEVEAGRFRRDLYYRLQVIEVSLPPLRARREDLPQLVDQLLNRLSHQLHQPNKKLTPAAWQKIYEYHWPGNIRELQNALTRALLTAADHGIDTNDIELGQEGWLAADLTSGASGSPTTPAPKTSLSDVAARGATALVDQTPPVNSTTDPWVVLSLIMRDQIQQLLAQQLAHAPIGRWLNDSLILTAYSYCNQVLRDTANLLGMAESTLRRQLTKAEQNQQNPLYVTSATWTEQQPAIVHALQQIFAANHQTEGLAHRIEQLLLQQIISVAPKRHAVGAALMGVTQATYLKRLHSHNINTRTERDEEQPLNANSGR